MSLRLQLVDRVDAVEASLGEWCAFADACRLVAPFCHPNVWGPWLLAQREGEPAVYEWRERGELRALIPMRRQGRVLEMAGGDHLDYQDIAALSVEDAIAALCAVVENERFRSATIVFSKVAEGSLLAAATGSARLAALGYLEERYWSRCLVAELPQGSGGDFSQLLSARQRKDYRNAARRIAEALPDHEVEHLGPGGFDPQLIEEIGALHQASQYRKSGPSVFQEAAYRRFLQSLTSSGAPLCLSLLRERPQGALVAFHLAYFSQDTFFHYLTAYADAQAKLSPGRWLLVDALRHWHERARRGLRYDMLCGEEAYKSRWPANPYFVSKIVLLPKRLANLPRLLAYSAVYSLKNAKNRHLLHRPCNLRREGDPTSLVLPS